MAKLTTEFPGRFDPLTRTTIRATNVTRGDLYHSILRMPWPQFLLGMAAVFVAINILFAALYLIGDAPIAGAAGGSFADHFFFSVQTLATIGYGGMYPRTLYGNVLVTLEAMVGLIGVGLLAALAFARFSLPRARIRFSAVAVIAPFDGAPTLMIRAANQRRNSIINARAQISLLRNEVTREGDRLRRFYDLGLARPETPMFAMSWLVMHPITSNSPLHNLTEADIQQNEFSLLVTIIGLDETLSQTVHARQAYFNTDVRWNHRFDDMIDELSSGNRIVDLSRIDVSEPIANIDRVVDRTDDAS